MADTLTLESMAASSPGSIRVGDDNNGTRKRSVSPGCRACKWCPGCAAMAIVTVAYLRRQEDCAKLLFFRHSGASKNLF
jgi:hypothetical protein